jgi:DNA polymerase-3 subunit epsilon
MQRDLICFWDTETTGFVDFKIPWNDPKQPNLLQLGMKVTTQSREVVFESGILVDSTRFPEWSGITEGALNAHKITEAVIREHGQDPQEVLNLWYKWAQRCGLFVAHNKEYDARVLQAFAFRLRDNPDIFLGGQTLCTMHTTRPLCKIQSQHYGGFKLPKLEEAYKALVDTRGFKGAHSALGDVNATSEIFWRLVDSEIFKFELKLHNPEMTHDDPHPTNTVPRAPP